MTLTMDAPRPELLPSVAPEVLSTPMDADTTRRLAMLGHANSEPLPHRITLGDDKTYGVRSFLGDDSEGRRFLALYATPHPDEVRHDTSPDTLLVIEDGGKSYYRILEDGSLGSFPRTIYPDAQAERRDQKTRVAQLSEHLGRTMDERGKKGMPLRDRIGALMDSVIAHPIAEDARTRRPTYDTAGYIRIGGRDVWLQMADSGDHYDVVTQFTDGSSLKGIKTEHLIVPKDRDQRLRRVGAFGLRRKVKLNDSVLSLVEATIDHTLNLPDQSAETEQNPAQARYRGVSEQLDTIFEQVGAPHEFGRAEHLGPHIRRWRSAMIFGADGTYYEVTRFEPISEVDEVSTAYIRVTVNGKSYKLTDRHELLPEGMHTGGVTLAAPGLSLTPGQMRRAEARAEAQRQEAQRVYADFSAALELMAA